MNNVGATATYATIPGGRGNRATNDAFAAGRNAWAGHTAAFVWSDSTGTSTSSTNNNSLTMRASRGYRFSTGTGTSGAYLAAGGARQLDQHERPQRQGEPGADWCWRGAG